MSISFRSPTRRSLLATAAAAAVFPRTVLGQSDPNNQGRTDVKIRLIFDRHAMTATLYDNPSARDFASMLPLDLEIDDFGSTEKIAYLPR